MNTISRRDLFIQAINADMYKSLAWSIRCFSICQGFPSEPYTPYLEEGKWLVMFPGEEEPRLIEDAPGDKPVYYKRDKLTYQQGEFIGANAAGETTYTRILWHHIMVVYAFGETIPFDPNGRDIPKLEKIISENLVSNPKEGEEVPPGKFTVDQMLAFTEAASSVLEGLAPIFAPASTEKSLVTDPMVRKVREQRLKENAGRLHDPAVISSIKNELIEMDKAYLKGDDAMDALAVSSKAFNQVRVKTLCIHGEESAFTDGTSVTLIPTSLDEGLDLKFVPAYANSVRQGSFNRGSETALGGELTQFLIRIFQSHTVDVSKEDCGTKRGLLKVIPATYASWYVGLNIFEGGASVQLTDENIGKYVGKEVLLRSPQYCRSPGNTFCTKCLGETNAADPNALGGSAVDIGNTILYVFMKKAHGSALKTNAFDLELDLY